MKGFKKKKVHTIHVFVDGRSSSLSTVHSAGNSRDNTPTPSNRKKSPGTTNSNGELILFQKLKKSAAQF